MSCLTVSDDIVAVSNAFYIDFFYKSDNVINKLTIDPSPSEDETVTDLIISYDSKFLAVLLSLSKRVIIYELQHMQQILNITLPRRASKIRFNISNTQIFVADKTGDVLSYDIPLGNNGIKILGHLSLLLNVLQTDDSKYLISCDRDEKIKVSCYPNTYNIQTYCLGHKEFVNHIELLPHLTEYLTSSSGDGTVKIWNYVNGILMHTIDTGNDLENTELQEKFCKTMDEDGIEVSSLPIVHYSISKYDENSSILAIAVHTYMKIMIYRLQSQNKKFSHNLISELPVDQFPFAIKVSNLSLYVYDNVDFKIKEYHILNKNENIIIEFAMDIQVFKERDCKSEKYDPDAIKVLFKRKFDNVQEYQERKKLRLEKS